MSTCLNFKELIEINEPQVEEMQRVGESFESVEVPGACEAFSQTVYNVESILAQVYRAAVAYARKSDELKAEAEIWENMGLFCNAILKVLLTLKDKYPECGTPQLYDLALDYKLSCVKRHQSIERQIACQTKIPAGLFPSLS